jgi:hypothetical protein
MGPALTAALALLNALIENAGQISQLIQGANVAGQTELTAAQWATIVGADDSAEAALTAAISAAAATPVPPAATPVPAASPPAVA